jgi:hypothetical protein
LVFCEDCIHFLLIAFCGGNSWPTALKADQWCLSCYLLSVSSTVPHCRHSCSILLKQYIIYCHFIAVAISDCRKQISCWPCNP